MALFARNPEPLTPDTNLPPPPPSGQPSQAVNISRRLRILEERYNNIQKQLQFNEKSLLDSKKKTSDQIHDLNTSIGNLSREIDELRESASDILTEVKRCSKKEELLEIQKTLEIWEPMTFITAEEAKKIIQEMLSQKK